MRYKGEHRLFVVGDNDHIIHEADIMQAGEFLGATAIRQAGEPVVEVIEVVVHSVLPYQMADGSSDACGLLEKALGVGYH